MTSNGKLDTRLNGKGYVNVDGSIMAAFPDGRFIIASGAQVAGITRMDRSM